MTDKDLLELSFGFLIPGQTHEFHPCIHEELDVDESL